MKEQERPRITVRKDAQRELEFRYNRQERLDRDLAPRPASPGGSILRNRSLRIVLLNMLLLGAIVFAGQRLLLASGDRARVGAYSASLQALRFEGTVYATLTLRLTGRPAAGGERFAVRFVLEPGEEGLEQSAALPVSPGEEVTVGEAIPLTASGGEPRNLRAELTVGGKTRRLNHSLR